MAVKYTWFKFSPSAWMTGKISRRKLSPEAKESFMDLICLYFLKECIFTLADAQLEVGKENIDALVKKEIIKLDGDFIRISFIDEQWDEIRLNSDKKRVAAEKRWKKPDAPVMHVHDGALQNDAEKIREDKNRVEKKVNDIDDRKLKFAHTLEPFKEKYSRPMLNDFFKYWTEPNKSGTKFKQEMEKTWSLERRLETWAKNDKTFPRNSNTAELGATDTYVAKTKPHNK
ncbi:MAG: hypothetical protein ACRCYO_13485 [Bacteroidia bacterium]